MIIIISIILFMLFFLMSNRKNRTLFTSLSITLFAGILLLTNGQFEYNDYPEYLKLFIGHQGSVYGDLDVENGYELEKPYAYFNYIVRFFLPRMAYSYILCYGLMWILPIRSLLKKGSYCVPLSLFLICSFLNCSQLLFIITAQRQMIANVAILWAYYIFQYTNYKKKKKVILIVTLLTIALLSHSSSYFVIPLLPILYIIKFPPKKYIIVIMLLSLFFGPTVQNFFRPIFYGLMIQLGSGDEIARSTTYYINDIYEAGTGNINSLLPSTAVGIVLVYFYSKEELKSYGAKLISFSVIAYNLFNSVPLINRALMIFFVLGMILGIPNYSKNTRLFKLSLVFVGSMLIYTAIKYGYLNGGENNRLFPYPYIWENPTPFKIYDV